MESIVIIHGYGTCMGANVKAICKKGEFKEGHIVVFTTYTTQ